MAGMAELGGEGIRAEVVSLERENIHSCGKAMFAAYLKCAASPGLSLL